MKAIKTALDSTWSDNPPLTLEAQLAVEPDEGKGRDLHRLTVRLPVAVARELHDLARSRQVAVNELVAIFVDQGLLREGRASIVETAPWFASYLRRASPDENRPQGKAIFE
jgi:hypothetical protein